MASEENQRDSFIDVLKNFFLALVTLTEDFVELAKLELQLAGKSLVLIIVFYIAIIFFFVSAWFFILAAIAALLVMLKLNWVLALLAVAGFNFFLIILAAMLIAKYKRYLTFPATRRQLKLFGGEHETHHRTASKKD